MLKFDKTTIVRSRGRHTKIAALLGAVIALIVPVSILADASGHDGELVTVAMQPNTGGGSNAMTRGYELRCWQEGRLILQENFLQPPGESSADALRMTDPEGRPVRVLETTNATCLLKAIPTPPRAMRP